jgi:hypothetical protein
MELTAVIVALVIGALAGWLAGLLVEGAGFGLIGNIVVGPRLVVGEFPCARKKVDVVDGSASVSSRVEQGKPWKIGRLAVFHHATRPWQCDDDIFVRGLNTEL